MKQYFRSLSFSQKALSGVVVVLLTVSVLFPPIDNLARVESGILRERGFVLDLPEDDGASPWGFVCFFGDGPVRQPIAYTMWLGEWVLLGITALGIVIWPLVLGGRFRAWDSEAPFCE